VRAGFIGLGNMGVRIADQIVEAGFPLAVWARRSASVEPYAGRPGVAIVDSPAAVGAASDVVGLCVWSDDDVEDVLLRDDGVLAGMAPGGIVAIHSTVSPELCARLAERAAAGGVAVVDAPVSARAMEKKLLVMVGGDDEPVARCRPLFTSFGDPVVHLGGLGSGQLAKLVNNVLLAAHIALADDALALGKALGLDEDQLAEALLRGSSSTVPGMQMLRGLAAPPTDESSQTRKWAIKDVALMLEVLGHRGVADERPLLAMGRLGATITAEGRAAR